MDYLFSIQVDASARLAADIYAELQRLWPMFEWTYVMDRDRPGTANFTSHSTVRGKRVQGTQSCLLHSRCPPASVLADEIGWQCIQQWVAAWRGESQA